MADRFGQIECSFQAITYFCYQFTSIFDNDVSTMSIAYRLSKISICNGNLSVVDDKKPLRIVQNGSIARGLWQNRIRGRSH